MKEETRIKIKEYTFGFLAFIVGMGISFFVGFKIGQNVSQRELKKEVGKAEDDVEKILKDILKESEEKKKEEIRKFSEEKVLAKEEVSEEAKNIPGTATSEITAEHEILEKGKERESEGEKIGKEEGKGKDEKINEEGKGKEEEKVGKVGKGEEKMSKEEEKIGKGIEKGKKLSDVKKGVWEEKKGINEERGEWIEGGGRWTVQVASLERRSDAERIADNVKSKGFPAYIVKASVKGKTYYRVRIGKLKTKERAEKLKKEIEKFGIKGIVTL